MSTLRIPLLPSTVRWALVLAVAVAIAALSLTRSGAGGPPAFGPFGLVGLDKWLHAGAYVTLATSLVYALADRSLDRVLVLVLVAAVGYGLLIEGLQGPLPYRTFSYLDVVANASGATIAVGAWWLVHRAVRFQSLGTASDG